MVHRDNLSAHTCRDCAGYLEVDFCPKPFTPGSVNTEIVLDRSSGMERAFTGGTTKLKAAEGAVLSVIINRGLQRTNLALRVFGGPCPKADTEPIERTEPTVNFSRENWKPISNAIGALKAQGDASLTQALLQAITDFDDPTRFKDVSNRVIVITGSPDACGASSGPLLYRLTDAKEAQAKVVLDFHFIGVDIGDETARSQLSALAHETGSVADFADTQQELEEKIKDAWRDRACHSRH